MMSSNIESLGSNLLRRLFNRIPSSKLMGVGIGTAITAIIQSSGAATVMIIGFVNAGLMTLESAASMIYGANIGTTVTALLVATGIVGKGTLIPSIAASFAFFGTFIRIFSKRDKNKKIGDFLIGFGLLFTSLTLMNGVMVGLQNIKDSWLLTNDALLLVLGVVITALAQSSSAVTSIVIVMLSSNLIDLHQGIYLAIGSNIGSCLPAIIAGYTAGEKNAKRAAVLHLTFNVIGALLFILAGAIIRTIGGPLYDMISNVGFVNEMKLALFHTTFNIVTVMFVLPLTNQLIWMLTKIIPDKSEIESFGDVSYINDQMLKIPSIAVQRVRNQLINMARVAEENFNISCDVLCGKDPIELKNELERFKDNEEQLDNLSKGVVHYIVKLSSMNLIARDLLFVSTVHYSISDLKHVGDYANNILKYAERFVNSGDKLSPYAVADIEKMKRLIHNLCKNIMSCYRRLDMDVLKEALDIEDQVNVTTDRIVDDHIKRLNNGICTAGTGAEYLFLISDIKKTANHFMNLGKTLTISCQK